MCSLTEIFYLMINANSFKNYIKKKNQYSNFDNAIFMLHLQYNLIINIVPNTLNVKILINDGNVILESHIEEIPWTWSHHGASLDNLIFPAHTQLRSIFALEDLHFFHFFNSSMDFF